MRILGIGEYADLGDVYLRLVARGHEVKLFSSIRGCHDILAGMIERVTDWRAELDWVRAAGRGGIVVFETANNGALQDKLRASGLRVIGGSAFGDQLENDRVFAQTLLRELGHEAAPITISPTSMPRSISCASKGAPTYLKRTAVQWACRVMSASWKTAPMSLRK